MMYVANNCVRTLSCYRAFVNKVSDLGIITTINKSIVLSAFLPEMVPLHSTHQIVHTFWELESTLALVAEDRLGCVPAVRNRSCSVLQQE